MPLLVAFITPRGSMRGCAFYYYVTPHPRGLRIILRITHIPSVYQKIWFQAARHSPKSRHKRISAHHLCTSNHLAHSVGYLVSNMSSYR
jgi:hypothetical protein